MKTPRTSEEMDNMMKLILWGPFILACVEMIESSYVTAGLYIQCKYHGTAWLPGEDFACEICRIELLGVERVSQHAQTCGECKLDWNKAVDHLCCGLPPWAPDELKKFEEERWKAAGLTYVTRRSS